VLSLFVYKYVEIVADIIVVIVVIIIVFLSKTSYFSTQILFPPCFLLLILGNYTIRNCLDVRYLILNKLREIYQLI
jgi:hypothetical protein